MELQLLDDFIVRQSAARATFGLSEIIPAIITGIQALKSRPKSGLDYVDALYKYTFLWNLAHAASPVHRTPLLSSATSKTRQGFIPFQRKHPYEDTIELIRIREGVPRSQAEQLFQETLGYASRIGGFPMALNVGGLLQGVAGIFGGNQNPYFQTVSSVAGLASNFFQPSANVPAVAAPRPMPMSPTLVSGPVALPRIGVALTQEVFNAGNKMLARLGLRFPATTSGFTSVLRRALLSVASLARRTPVGTMVSVLIGLGLTAYEANLLTVWHSQRRRGRRINPSNSKALRRAVRRIKSFHKLCTHTDVIRSRGRSRTSARCGSCRKNPCRC